jgi:hypothetical protein
MRNKAVLFVCPDYHCSFFYRGELRRRGWKSDIYLPENYPPSLLYSDEDLIYPLRLMSNSKLSKIVNRLFRMFWYLSVFWQYKYHVYYGGLNAFNFGEKYLGLHHLFGSSFSIPLLLAKIFGSKIILFPSGVPEEEMPEVVFKLGNEEAGLPINDEEEMKLWFEKIKRYADKVIGSANLDSTQYVASHIKYKSLDLNLFKKDLWIPKEHRLPPTNKLRILHSFKFMDLRVDIKGTKFVERAVNKLISEGFEVEYLFYKNIDSKNMRYLQSQADIVVEQLIRGWWGSTGIECMALGKPVVCYLRPEWKKFFLNIYPEYNQLPIIEANKENIYDVLSALVTDKKGRELAGDNSLRFAKMHFDIKNNANEFIRFMESI